MGFENGTISPARPRAESFANLMGRIEAMLNDRQGRRQARTEEFVRLLASSVYRHRVADAYELVDQIGSMIKLARQFRRTPRHSLLNDLTWHVTSIKSRNMEHPAVTTAEAARQVREGLQESDRILGKLRVALEHAEVLVEESGLEFQVVLARVSRVSLIEGGKLVLVELESTGRTQPSLMRDLEHLLPHISVFGLQERIELAVQRQVAESEVLLETLEAALDMTSQEQISRSRLRRIEGSGL